jgi:hypothetical protein
MNGDTQVQLIALKDDLTAIDVASGTARFYNRDKETVIKVTTPFGDVIAPPETAFDIYVGDDSAEVISLRGSVDFVRKPGGKRFAVMEGGSSIVAEKHRVAAGDAGVELDWDRWNSDRDALWARRGAIKGDSVRYLPPKIRDEAYPLDEHGRWDRVYYDGGYRYFWRPVRVGVGWAPFTMGRWTVWYGDNTWIPDEPFGYVTHHYGNWIYTNNFWYWAPPVVQVTAGLPLLRVGFGWYPGRVGWVHSDLYVGWVPLAPFEPYYTHRYWGRRSVVYSSGLGVTINIGGFRYAERVIVVPRHNFHSVRNYRSFRIHNVGPAMRRNFSGAPVINNTVINNYHIEKNRYHFTDVRVTRKPHATAVERIRENKVHAVRSADLQGSRVRQDLERLQQGKPDRQTGAKPLRVRSRMVAVDQVHRPASEVKFGEKDLRERRAAGLGERKEAPGLRTEGQRRPGDIGTAREATGTVETRLPGKPEKREDRVRPGSGLRQEDRTRPRQPTPAEGIQPPPAAAPGTRETRQPGNLEEREDRVRPGSGLRREDRIRPPRPAPAEGIQPAPAPGSGGTKPGIRERTEDRIRVRPESGAREEERVRQRRSAPAERIEPNPAGTPATGGPVDGTRRSLRGEPAVEARPIPGATGAAPLRNERGTSRRSDRTAESQPGEAGSSGRRSR